MSNGRKPHGAAAAGDAFERFEEDELAGEVTRLEPGAMLAEQPTNLIDEGPPMPFLVCESGKDTGKEYVVAVGENGIGRSIDNEVILTDISVSRKHLKVLRNEHGELAPLSVEVGDKIMFSKYGFDEIKVGGVEYLILPESSILAIIE